MKKHLTSIIGILISVVLLWWVLRDQSLSRMMLELSRANPWEFIVAVVLSTMIFPIRARKWRTILDPIHPKLPLGPLWRAVAIGAGVNNLIPARAGEAARAYAITRSTPVSLSTSIASLAVDRVFDAIVLLVLAFGAVMSPAFPSDVRIMGQSVTSLTVFPALGVVILLGALYALVFFPTYLIKLYELFARRISPTLEAKGRAALLSFSEGLSVLRSPGHFAAVFAWTVLHWLVNAAGWWVAMRAVGIQVPFSAAILIQSLVALGVALPSAPGFFGLFETAAIAGLAIYGVSRDLATTWAIGFHVASFVPITLIGAYYFSRMDLHLRDIQSSTQKD